MKNYKSLKLWIVFAVALLVACAGSQKSVDDDFTAESVEDYTSESGEDSAVTDENEVLRLLGLDEEPTSGESEEPTAEPTKEDLQKRIVELEADVNEKNVQVANLKAELAEKEKKIQQIIPEPGEALPESESARTVATSGTFKERYDLALSYYNNKQYRQALRIFDELLRSGQGNSLLDNCQYWKGECYYGVGNHNQAIIEFERVFEYKNSNKLDDSQLKLGLCHLKLGNVEKARSEFRKLIENYPDSEYVSNAEYYLTRF
ncbi:tetratricopeptide repeat protein [candidate division KSB1 bacterium]|nr:tetratricopeptide repeat protein [candidate division KSB1 bacterium]